MTSPPVISGSNPLLTEETADSLTLGAVIQPRFIPGLSVSVDYYKIKVNDVITALAAQQIANLCYDSSSLNNPFCGLFQRNPGPGNTPQQFEPGQIIENTLIQAGVNFAAFKRKGIDINVAYRTNVGPFRYNTNFIMTHNLETSNFTDPTDPGFENRILGELGDPENEFRWDNDISHGPFTLGYRMRSLQSNGDLDPEALLDIAAESPTGYFPLVLEPA